MNVGGWIIVFDVYLDFLDIIWVGVVLGGVFWFYDCGDIFEAVFDDQISFFVGDFDIVFFDFFIIYVGIGEVNVGGGFIVYDGVGMYKSMDGGVFFEFIGLE